MSSIFRSFVNVFAAWDVSATQTKKIGTETLTMFQGGAIERWEIAFNDARKSETIKKR